MTQPKVQAGVKRLKKAKERVGNRSEINLTTLIAVMMANNMRKEPD